MDRLHGRVEDVGNEDGLVVARRACDPVAAPARWVAGSGDESRPDDEQPVAEGLAVGELDRGLRLAVGVGGRLVGLQGRHELGGFVRSGLVLRGVDVARRDERPVPGTRAQVHRGAAREAGLTRDVDHRVPVAPAHRVVRAGPRTIGTHEGDAVGHLARLAPSEAGHAMSARHRLRREGASEPLRSAEDEQVHAVITARHGCPGHRCSPSANLLALGGAATCAHSRVGSGIDSTPPRL